MATTELSVIIVNWNTKDALRACLGSLRDGCGEIETEIWVVDNASEDGSADMVETLFPEAKLIRNSGNLGLTKANNQALVHASGDYVMFLNSDAQLKPGAAHALIDFIERRPKAAAVGPRISWPDGKLQPSTYPAPALWRDALQALHLYKLLPVEWIARWLLGGHWPHDKSRAVGRLTGACWIVRRAVINELGGLDDNFWDGSAHDFCLSARKAGWEIWFTPNAEAVHQLGVSAKQRWSPEERKIHVMEETKKLFIKHRGTFWFKTYSFLYYCGHLAARSLRGRNLSPLHEVELHWYKRQILKETA